MYINVIHTLVTVSTNEDCSCLKRWPWDKFDRMRLATTPRSVCWRRVANGNALYTFSSVCPNDRSLPTSSATTRPSVHWKGVSNGRVLCSCSDLWKRLTSNQTWWATTAASLAATVLGSGKPPWTSLRRCSRKRIFASANCEFVHEFLRCDVLWVTRQSVCLAFWSYVYWICSDTHTQGRQSCPTLLPSARWSVPVGAVGSGNRPYICCKTCRTHLWQICHASVQPWPPWRNVISGSAHCRSWISYLGARWLWVREPVEKSCKWSSMSSCYHLDPHGPCNQKKSSETIWGNAKIATAWCNHLQHCSRSFGKKHLDRMISMMLHFVHGSKLQQVSTHVIKLNSINQY